MKALVFSDNQEIITQILTALNGKADADAAVLSPVMESMDQYGATRLYELTGNPGSDAIFQALSKIFTEGKYDLFLAGSTVRGREVAGMMSEALNLPAMTEINDISFRDGKIVTKRFFYGGKTLLEEESGARVLTVMAGISEAARAQGKSELVKVELPASKITTVNRIDKMAGSVNIEKAQVIVSVGRGIGSKENIEKVKPLAEAVHGEIAGSRPVCLDYQWLSEDRQVGLSGKKVKPKLYIALGISGQIQHIAGMRTSRVVVAVNKDKSAPIFEEADYGIVGDLFQIVPKLVSALKQ
ncbi:MAG: electron transfer flavoprotein subunit alpha/FixB family protein [Candidatus Thermoplasmatota archaeon]|nr:electron transfer flavoprotein subunit alpha/FixB family protein [Candidatus Thermoplasmatota archaeon]